jgi:hypothetical protein
MRPLEGYASNVPVTLNGRKLSYSLPNSTHYRDNLLDYKNANAFVQPNVAWLVCIYDSIGLIFDL